MRPRARAVRPIVDADDQIQLVIAVKIAGENLRGESTRCRLRTEIDIGAWRKRAISVSLHESQTID